MRLGLGLGNDLHGQSRGGVFGGLLLDQYSGAAAAYSLRKISSNTTNVVRVRRSSDNAEQDFTATEVTDGTLETWVGANDGFVATWYDQSGNVNDATQSTAANQPKIVDAGVLVEENGKPAVDFGVGLSMSSGNLTSSVDCDVFIVYNISGQNVFANDASSSPFVLIAADGLISNTWSGVGSPTVRNNGILLSPLNRDTLYDTLINNQTLITVESIDLSGISNFTINGFSSFQNTDKVQEIIIYDSDQSSNRTGIEDNINSYYNIY